jgi:molybdopterin/thiamine biosynthesis adenylyltransferase
MESPMTRPRLKRFTRITEPGSVTLVREPGVEYTLSDPDGQVTALLDLLDGTRGVATVGSDLRRQFPELTASDIMDGITALDDAGLLEDAVATTGLTSRQQERYASNLNFFSSYAHLGHSRFDYQDALRRSRVVLLGVGGVGSTLLYNLAGLGVGQVVALDCDEVELKNLSRQFLYDEGDVGQSKVERAATRVRKVNGEMDITAVDRRVAGPDDLANLLPGADLVLAVIDQPADVRQWINEACVAASVPFITGGIGVTRGAYWSVAPGVSGCMACQRSSQRSLVDTDPSKRVNRAIGPAAGLVGSLIALEAVRYLTGFAPPVSAGRVWAIDLATGQTDIALAWERRPDCPVCSGPSSPAALSAGVPAMIAGVA